jgi:hypothetical protein
MKDAIMKNKNKAGFSLTEIAMALMVIGLGMTAVLAIFPVALNMNTSSTQKARMTLLGEEIFSELRASALSTNLYWGPGTTAPAGMKYVDDAIRDGDLDIHFPMRSNWDYTKAPIDTANPTRNQKFDVIHPHLDRDTTDPISSYQEVWYIDKATGLDSHNVGVRVTIFTPQGAYLGDRANSSREVEVAMWEVGSVPDAANDYRDRFRPVRFGLARENDPELKMYGIISRNTEELR